MNSIKSIGLEELTDTVFIKDFSKDNLNLKNLEHLLTCNDDIELKNKLKKDIHLIKQGLEGENNVYFELKNSLLPMICLHDIRIKVGQNYAQIDFLVITNKFICIMETKNLVGDITVTRDGDFIRDIKYKDGSIREGMYNPVTQGRRHARLLQRALIDAGIAEISTFPIKSIAVMANHKNIIDKTEAPDSIKGDIYRCDQVVNFLEDEMSSAKYEVILTDSRIMHIGEIISKMNTPLEFDYLSKYGVDNGNQNINKNQERNSSNTVVNFTNKDDSESYKISKSSCNNLHATNSNYNLINKKPNSSISVSLNSSDYEYERLVKKLKKFRYETAQSRNIKPYEIFTNKEMELMINIKPKSILDLKQINLRIWVINELGIDILQILNPDVSYTKETFLSSIGLKGLEAKLKEYRAKMAMINKVPAYEIFTNAELTRLIEAKPHSIDELFEIKGFAKNNKIKNYGKDILNIING